MCGKALCLVEAALERGVEMFDSSAGLCAC